MIYRHPSSSFCNSIVGFRSADGIGQGRHGMVTWYNCRGPHSPSYEREAGSLGSSNASHRMRGSHTWAKCIRGAQRILATDGQFKIIILRQHYEPLKRAARLLHIPCEHSFEGYRDAVDQLIGTLASPDRDMWVSSTLFVTEGHFGEDTVVDLVPTAYHQDKGAPWSIQVGVSTGNEAVIRPCQLELRRVAIIKSHSWRGSRESPGVTMTWCCSISPDALPKQRLRVCSWSGTTPLRPRPPRRVRSKASRSILWNRLLSLWA